MATASRRISAAVVAVGAAVALVPMPEASADIHKVLTMIHWGGADCINITAPNPQNYSLTAPMHSCDPKHAVMVEVTAIPGNFIGADPHMGGAAWISCELWIDGARDYTDFAEAGDGHDANCLRNLWEPGGGWGNGPLIRAS